MGRNKSLSRSATTAKVPPHPAAIRALLPRALGRLRTETDELETSKPRSPPSKPQRTSSEPCPIAMGCLLQTSAISENSPGTSPVRNSQSSRCLNPTKKPTSLSDTCLSLDTTHGTNDASPMGCCVERKSSLLGSSADAKRCQDSIDAPLNSFAFKLNNHDGLIGHPRDLEEEQRASVGLEAGYNMFEDMSSLYNRVSRMSRHQVEQLLLRTCVTLRQRDFALLAKYERDREHKIHLEKISQSPSSHWSQCYTGTYNPLLTPGRARDDVTEQNRYLREKLFRFADENGTLKRKLQQERDLAEFIRNEALVAEVDHVLQLRKYKRENDDVLAQVVHVFEDRSPVAKNPVVDEDCNPNCSALNVTSPRSSGCEQAAGDSQKRDWPEKMLLHRKNMSENKLVKRESPRTEPQGSGRNTPTPVLESLSDCLVTNKSVLNGNQPRHKVSFSSTVKYLNGDLEQKRWNCDLRAPRSILKANSEPTPSFQTSAKAEHPPPIASDAGSRTSTRTEFFAVQREQRLTRWKSAASPSTSDDDESTVVLEITGSKLGKKKAQHRQVLPILGIATDTSYLLENVPGACRFQENSSGISV